MVFSCLVEACTSKIVVDYPSPQFRYTCKNHPREQQIAAACPGRKYDLAKDHEDEQTRYQANQFLRPDEEGREMEELGKKIGPGNHADRYQFCKARENKGNIPEWALDDAEVQKLLLRSFPRMAEYETYEGARQRMKAGRWYQLIHLHFRMRYTLGQIAADEDMQLTIEQVKNLKRRILRAAAGLNTAGKIRGKRGRPRKINRLENIDTVSTLSVRSQASRPCVNTVHDLPNPAGFDRQGFSFDADSKA